MSSMEHGEAGRAGVRSEVLLGGASIAEFLRGKDEPEANWGRAGADPTMDPDVLVVHRVLILIFHLSP